MNHIKDREAIHTILEAVLDYIERLGEDNYVTFDVSTYSLGVRASCPTEREGWSLYLDYTSQDTIGPEEAQKIMNELEVLKETSTTDEE